jgi:hypothetical protein
VRVLRRTATPSRRWGPRWLQASSFGHAGADALRPIGSSTSECAREGTVKDDVEGRLYMQRTNVAFAKTVNLISNFVGCIE